MFGVKKIWHIKYIEKEPMAFIASGRQQASRRVETQINFIQQTLELHHE